MSKRKRFNLDPPDPPKIKRARSESPPPPPEEAQQQSTDTLGYQVIVSGLERSSVQSARAHFLRVASEYNQSVPEEDRLPSLIVNAPNDIHPVDYVYVAISSTATPEPRADWLEMLMTIFRDRGFRADWKVNNGDDRTRRVFFIAQDEHSARALRPRLDEYLRQHHIEVQGSFVSRTGNPRVVYDVVSPDAVQWLVDHPPVFDRQAHHVTQHRFIQPLWPDEIAVPRCREFQYVRNTIDRYIRQRYGDVIATSRMALEGDVYCVVFTHLAHASAFLRDPFDIFDSDHDIFTRQHGPSKPFLLYKLNSMGMPRDPAFMESGGPSSALQSSELRRLHARLDEVEHGGTTFMRTVESMHTDLRHSVDQIAHHSLCTASAMMGLVRSLRLSNNAQTIAHRLDALRSERTQVQMTLCLMGPSSDIDPATLRTQLADLNNRITLAEQEYDQADHTADAAANAIEAAITSIQLPSSSPLRSLPSQPPPPSTSISLDEDTPMAPPPHPPTPPLPIPPPSHSSQLHSSSSPSASQSSHHPPQPPLADSFSQAI